MIRSQILGMLCFLGSVLGVFHLWEEDSKRWASRHTELLEDLSTTKAHLHFLMTQDAFIGLQVCQTKLESAQSCEDRAYVAEAEYALCARNLELSTYELIETQSECGL